MTYCTPAGRGAAADVGRKPQEMQTHGGSVIARTTLLHGQERVTMERIYEWLEEKVESFDLTSH